LSWKKNKIHIYETKGDSDTTKWVRKWTLQEHTKQVMDIDWAPESNLILSASQDRNAYVWTLIDTKNEKGESVQEWKPTLVILRFNRAATCCKWSKNENKFAVGSGAKVIAVCHFDTENNWWISKMIKKNKPHTSTVLSIDWHPQSNLWLASGCCDFKARTFSTWIKGVDPKDQKSEFSSQKGDWSVKGWVHDIKWSPSGDSVAFVGHDSTLYISSHEDKEPTHSVPTQFNTFKKLLWLSEHSIVTVGHDFTPICFSNKTSDSIWQCFGKAEPDNTSQTSSQSTSQTPKRGGLNQPEQQSQTGTSINTKHKNTITGLNAWRKSEQGNVTEFVTCALDGKILFWKVSDLEKTLNGFKTL